MIFFHQILTVIGIFLLFSAAIRFQQMNWARWATDIRREAELEAIVIEWFLGDMNDRAFRCPDGRMAYTKEYCSR